ncbi:MAG: 50S ribosomal protein L35 [Candidatus Improbicoccus devescovinae]|nr:MAG: 50S ribosomal protein L35 [Candidatus Improbicoccus devescovinae]
MYKIKTHKGAKKRFKMSANGKLVRWHANKNHILSKKKRKRKRFLRQSTVASVTNYKQVIKMLPYLGGKLDA